MIASRPVVRIAATAAFFAVLLSATPSTRPAHALPPGRAWMPVQTFKIPGNTWAAPGDLGTDSSGVPMFIGEGLGGIGARVIGARWQDTTWTVLWQLPYGVNPIKPMLSSEGRWPVVWQHYDRIDPNHLFAWLVTAEVFDDRISERDTVARDYGRSFAYSGAMSPRRRWVAKDSLGHVRVYFSDTAKVWRRINAPGWYGSVGMGMGAVDDTTALLVYGWDLDGITWGMLRGSRWEVSSQKITNAVSLVSHLRTRPSGGWWLAWAAFDSTLLVNSYRNGAWTVPETLTCATRFRGGPYGVVSAEMSCDDAEYPTLAWMLYSNLSGLTTICVCVPTDSGFTVADELAGSEGGVGPEVARDRNGDVWVGWWIEYDGMFWTHSYVRATAVALAATGSTAERTVRWTLSEPAPGSWWAVLRAPPGGAFEQVARVRAGDSPALEWRDAAPAPDTLRYRIRRESVDRRYEWTSDEVLWVHDPTPALVALLHAEASPQRVRLVWAGVNAGALAAAVERRTEAEDWRALGAARPDGPERLAFDDAAVEPGVRYAYRLAWTEAGAERRSAEAWIEVPRAFELALEGLRPNPSAGRPQVAFTLPAAGRARLELLDVAGRRVLRHDAGALPAGRHVVDLADAARLAPGVYVVRLAFGDRVVQRRGVIVR